MVKPPILGWLLAAPGNCGPIRHEWAAVFKPVTGQRRAALLLLHCEPVATMGILRIIHILLVCEYLFIPMVGYDHPRWAVGRCERPTRHLTLPPVFIR